MRASTEIDVSSLKVSVFYTVPFDEADPLENGCFLEIGIFPIGYMSKQGINGELAHRNGKCCLWPRIS